MASFLGYNWNNAKYTGVMSTEDRLILLSIAAEELGYTSERLRQFIKAGKVEGVRRGRLWFLRESEIEYLRGETKGGYGHERRLARCAEAQAPYDA